MTARLSILTFVLGLILSACGPTAPEKSEPLPDWIIPPDKMTDVLTDVHIIEGARIGTSVLGDSLPAIKHYEVLWSKYGITEELYDSSYRFYSRNAERMDLMYEEVLERLTKMSTELEANPATQSREEEEEEELEEDS